MTTIIAAHVQQQEEAQQVVSDLIRAGFVAAHTATFFVNPPGQHDLYPIGGDEDASPGTEDSGRGSVAGAAVGGAAGVAVGLITMPLLGPAAAVAATGVGGYVGSLYGALGTTDDKKNPETQSEREEDRQRKPPRTSGMLVAVSAPSPAEQESAIRIFRARAVTDIERAEGTITEGNWIDFNPLTPLTLVPG